jgi:putative flippase GtrA
MFEWRSPSEWKRLWRYYQAGVVNTAFGYGLYALLVGLGLNIYVAQIISHVAGATFNYFTYSRFAFAGHDGSKSRFIASYAFSYLLGLASLAAAVRVTPSPYLAGFASVLFVSLINYFVLKRLVFRIRPSRT